MRVLSLSVTAAGARMAAQLPYEHLHGDAAATVRSRWAELDAFVLFLATGAAVRIVAPLLTDKVRDPAVVCVDEAGRFAVALCGGHAGGANALAHSVAAALGAEAVVTTATDAAGLGALDNLPGFASSGDVAGVTTAMLDGRLPLVENELGWPLPIRAGDGPHRVVVSDRLLPDRPAQVGLHPRSLVVGVGASTGAPAGDLRVLLESALTKAGLNPASIAELATLDRKAAEPAITALGYPIRTFTPAELASVEVPTPSPVVAGAVGTASVAEAAALLAAGPGASLVVTKQKSATATVAIARRRHPRGHLALVGLGPGDVTHRTPAAERAVRRAEVVIGYGAYIDQCTDLLGPHQEIMRSPIGDEVVRAKQALADAGAGRSVAMVCSGDAGVYAMASIVLELAGDTDAGIEIVPGVTAALAAAAALGAPLGHDHVAISLSDLLTPWATIALRLRAAADADLVVALYNPRSKGRARQLDAARDILLTGRPPTTPVGIVTDAARPAQSVVVTTLGLLDPELVGMTTCVIVGASTTVVIGGRMVTPRGYAT